MYSGTVCLSQIVMEPDSDPEKQRQTYFFTIYLLNRNKARKEWCIAFLYKPYPLHVAGSSSLQNAAISNPVSS